jgi:hypothetical protein
VERPAFALPGGAGGQRVRQVLDGHDINAMSCGISQDGLGGFSPSIHTNAPTDVTVTIGWCCLAIGMGGCHAPCTTGSLRTFPFLCRKTGMRASRHRHHCRAAQ